MKKQRVREGGLVRIDLQDGSFAFGRILKHSDIAFYDLKSTTPNVDFDAIYKRPIAFIVPVFEQAIKSGRWPIIDVRPLEPALVQPRKYCVQDKLTGELSIYVDGKTTPATGSECAGLERAAVWEAEHVEDRLRDHFAGKPNKWVQQLQADR